MVHDEVSVERIRPLSFSASSVKARLTYSETIKQKGFYPADLLSQCARTSPKIVSSQNCERPERHFILHRTTEIIYGLITNRSDLSWHQVTPSTVGCIDEDRSSNIWLFCPTLLEFCIPIIYALITRIKSA